MFNAFSDFDVYVWEITDPLPASTNIAMQIFVHLETVEAKSFN